MLRWNAALLLAIISLGACAELNSLHRESVISPNGKARVVIVDAKQRNSYLNPEFAPPEAGKGQVGWRICAEAAPDVFSAFANSTGGDFGFGVGNQAKLSISSSEAAATIERTQTINLLRESFYRTCERYMSGGIDKKQFIVQAARDQRSMVAVLAIEQLTRAARPPSTILSGPPTSTSIKDGEAAAKLVDEFRVSAKTADAELQAADAALKKLNCADPLVEPTDGDQAKKDAYAACVAAKAAKATKKAESEKANERLDKALAIATDVTNSIGSSTQSGQQNTGQGGGGLDAASIAAVADAVLKIATGPGINEPLMYCIAYLTDNQGLDSVIRDKCLEILGQQQNQDMQLKGLIFDTDFSRASPTGKSLRQYAFGPSQAAIRAQRMAILKKAAKKIGIAADSRTITMILQSDDSDLVGKLREAAREFEPDPNLL